MQPRTGMGFLRMTSAHEPSWAFLEGGFGGGEVLGFEFCVVVAATPLQGRIQSRRVAYWMQSRRLRLLCCLHAVVTGKHLHRSASPEAVHTDRCGAGQGSRRRPRNL